MSVADLNKIELHFQLFCPNPAPLHRPHNNQAIFVDYTYLFPIFVPAHMLDNTLVTIVYHLLVPST